MRSQGSLLFGSMVVVVLIAAVHGQTSTTNNPASTAAGVASSPPFPYIAEVTGNDVYIRSGPGTHYYDCGKLNKGDRVKVVGRQFSWARIVPPQGSFSWISSQYVSVDPENPSVGIVTGDAVRVYAGSEHVRPIHSTTLQLKLNRGDRVKLLGERRENYYKIAPPTGAYLWISTNYIKPYIPPIELPQTPDEPNVTTPKPPAEPNQPAATEPTVPVQVSLEAQMLDEYQKLVKQIQAERNKPVDEQDYTEIKTGLAKIAENKQAGKAGRYAQFVLKQIERFELAVAIAKQVQLQDFQLRKVHEQIEKAKTTRLTQMQDLGRFAVIGKLQSSNVYGPDAKIQHFRILDDSGKTICYAVPTGPAAQMDLSKLINHKVGLVGTIQPHPQTGRALVRFTEIVELQ